MIWLKVLIVFIMPRLAVMVLFVPEYDSSGCSDFGIILVLTAPCDCKVPDGNDGSSHWGRT